MNDVNPLCSIAEVEKATIDCLIRTMKCVHVDDINELIAIVPFLGCQIVALKIGISSCNPKQMGRESQRAK